MSLDGWARSNLEYSRRVLNSGLEGARSGRAAFLNGRSLTPFLSESICYSWKPALIGACIGVVGGCRGNEKSKSKVLTCGFLGTAIGFAAGVAWNNRRLAASITHEAAKSIEKVRDEHWLEKHPIDYA